MKKLLPVLLWVAALSGLELYFMNFVKPQLDSLKKSSSTHNGVVDTGGTAPDHLVYTYQGKKYTWIHQKWYHYSGRHVYFINGTPTYFIYNRKVAQANHSVEDGTLVWDQKVIVALNEMMAKNPLSVYTPSGMKTLMNGVKAVQHEAADRAAKMNQLSE